MQRADRAAQILAAESDGCTSAAETGTDTTTRHRRINPLHFTSRKTPTRSPSTIHPRREKGSKCSGPIERRKAGGRERWLHECRSNWHGGDHTSPADAATPLVNPQNPYSISLHDSPSARERLDITRPIERRKAGGRERWLHECRSNWHGGDHTSPADAATPLVNPQDPYSISLHDSPSARERLDITRPIERRKAGGRERWLHECRSNWHGGDHTSPADAATPLVNPQDPYSISLHDSPSARERLDITRPIERRKAGGRERWLHECRSDWHGGDHTSPADAATPLVNPQDPYSISLHDSPSARERLDITPGRSSGAKRAAESDGCTSAA